MRKAYIVKGTVYEEDCTFSHITIGVFTTLDKAKREIRRTEALNNAMKQAVLDGKELYAVYYHLYSEEIYIY